MTGYNEAFVMQVDDGMVYVIEASTPRAMVEHTDGDFRSLLESWFGNEPDTKPTEDGEYDVVCDIIDDVTTTFDGTEYDCWLEDVKITARAEAAP